MVNDQNAGTPDPNDKLEDDVLKPVAEDDIKTKVLEKFGISEDDNPELLAKLVEEEKEHRKQLSTAITQKRKWREQAQAIKPAETPQPPSQPTQLPDIDKLVEEKLNERDLRAMPLSDDLKSEVKAYAKAKGIAYSEAANSPYISYLKEQAEEKRRSEEASISSKGGQVHAKTDFKALTDEQIKDLPTDKFKEYTEWLKKQ